MLGYSIITWILFTVILAIFAIFFLYRKIITCAFIILTIIFYISFAAAITTLFTPRIYTDVTEIVFEKTELGNQLLNLDKVVTTVGQTPGDIKNKIEDLISSDEEEKGETGFKSNVYPQFIKFLGSILRLFVFTISLILMLVITYIKYSYAGLMENINLHKRIDDLEQEIIKIKNGSSIVL